MKKKLDLICKKSFFLYKVEKKIEAGLVLTGQEVKAIRAHKISFSAGYVHFSQGEAWLQKVSINTGVQHILTTETHDRPKKLLLHRREIIKLRVNLKEKGYTLIPLRFYDAGGLIKVELGLCLFKKDIDRRKDIQKREQKIKMQQEMKVLSFT